MSAIEQQGTKLRRDQRGLVSITKSWVVDTLEETLSVGDAALLGLPEVGRDANQLEGKGRYLVNITYEGTQEENGREDSYEFDSSFAEEPIESHKDIEALKAAFGGVENDDGTITFPLKLPSSKQGGSGGLSGGKTTKSGKNPLYGLKTYPVLRAVFRHTYLRRTLPGGLLDKIGKIRKGLPEGFPTPNERDWLCMAPKVSRRGNVYEISEELMLSAPGGWPEAVHGLIQI